MARVLSIITTNVAPDERASFVVQARERQQVAKSVGCNYWVFSQDDAPATVSMIEFFEARDASTLERAQRAAGVHSPSLSFLREVEL